MPLIDKINLLLTLANLSESCYGYEVSHVTNIFAFAEKVLHEHNTTA